KPWYAKENEFYKGGTLSLRGQQSLDLILVPMDPISESKINNLKFWLNIRVVLRLISHLASLLSVPMGIISLLMVLLYPSLINFVVFTIYLVLGIIFLLDSLR